MSTIPRATRRIVAITSGRFHRLQGLFACWNQISNVSYAWCVEVDLSFINSSNSSGLRQFCTEIATEMTTRMRLLCDVNKRDIQLIDFIWDHILPAILAMWYPYGLNKYKPFQSKITQLLSVYFVDHFWRRNSRSTTWGRLTVLLFKLMFLIIAWNLSFALF